MTEATQLGKIIEFLYATDMVGSMDKLGHGGDIEFLTLAILELAVLFDWNVENATEFYKEVFDGEGVTVNPITLNKSEFVHRIKLNADLNNAFAVDEFVKALGFEVTPEVRVKFKKDELYANNFEEPTI